jgi:hypothetical protein
MGEPLKRTGTINLFDTHFGLWEEVPKDKQFHGALWDEMMHVFSALRGHMYQRGWTLEPESDVHKSIRKGHYVGRKGELEAVLECVGRTAKVEFFQSVNIKNPNGGRYDFDKYKLAPARLQRQMWAEMIALTKWAVSVGYHFDHTVTRNRPPIDVLRPIELQIREAMRTRVHYGNDPLAYFNAQWGADRFKRGDDGWPVDSAIGSYNRKDRDGALLSNGAIRYFYHWDKRVGVGRVFTSMNNMWEVWSLDCRNHLSKQSSHELFSHADADKLPRRKPLSHDEQIARLRNELEKATKLGNWSRVSTLGRVLAKLSAQQKAAA